MLCCRRDNYNAVKKKALSYIIKEIKVKKVIQKGIKLWFTLRKR